MLIPAILWRNRFGSAKQRQPVCYYTDGRLLKFDRFLPILKIRYKALRLCFSNIYYAFIILLNKKAS